MLKTREEIKSWLDKHQINNYTINDDLTVDVDGTVDLSYHNLTEILIQFNKVNGDFWCQNNSLTSLKGCPKEINGSFTCCYNLLTSLIGSPKIVKDSFDCSHNKLTSLIGSPKEVNGWFYCKCNNLISLEGSPKIVKGWFDCSDTHLLKSLKHLPKIHGKLYCDKSLKETREYKIYSISKKLKEMV